jgi:putative flippase GtrA
MVRLACRLLDTRFLRYVLASGGALAVDVGTFLALLSLGFIPAAASASGYSLGIVAHWLLSSRTVFNDGLAGRGPDRTRQKALFIGSALAGLALTTTIVGLGDLAGADPRIAKLAAIAASFGLTWILRARIVFRPRSGGDALGA